MIVGTTFGLSLAFLVVSRVSGAGIFEDSSIIESAASVLSFEMLVVDEELLRDRVLVRRGSAASLDDAEGFEDEGIPLFDLGFEVALKISDQNEKPFRTIHLREQLTWLLAIGSI